MAQPSFVYSARMQMYVPKLDPDVADAMEQRDMELEDYLGSLASVSTFGLEANRPSGSGGMRYFATDTFRDFIHDGTGWIIVYEPRQSFAPTTTQITHGTGGGAGTSGTYQRANGMCDVSILSQLGAVGAAMGTGNTWSIPVTAHTEDVTATVGRCALFDATGPLYGGDIIMLTATTVEVRGFNGSGAMSQIAAAVPFVWAVNDALRLRFIFRMSSIYS